MIVGQGGGELFQQGGLPSVVSRIGGELVKVTGRLCEKKELQTTQREIVSYHEKPIVSVFGPTEQHSSLQN